MLHRLIYASESTRPMDASTVNQLLAQARAANARRDITGALVLDAERFLQVLEGSRAQLSALYSRLVADDRHRALLLIEFVPIDERAFAGWNMAFAAADEATAGVLRRYTCGGRLNPEALSPAAALNVLCGIVALQRHTATPG